MKKPAILNTTAAIREKAFTVFLCTSISFFVFSPNIAAQDNTLFQMPVIPQSNQLNPALMCNCGVYVALPVISSVKFNIRNTGFGFHDVLHTGTGAQSDTYFLDLTNLDKKLKRMNYFRTNLDIDLLGFGFALQDWYFTFGIANHTELRFAYPHDIATLKDGNWQVDGGEAIPISLNGLGINLTVWNSIGVSAAREIMDGFKVGLRLKYLQGMANINTRRSNLELNTTSNPITLEAEMKYRMNASFPVTLGYASNGLVNNINIDNAFSNITGDYIFNRNRGLAVDAGIVYDLDDETQVSASFTDLGFIWWKKNVNNFEASGKYAFNGIDLDQYQTNPGQIDFLEALQDTLFQVFRAAGTEKSYLTFTSLKVFGGITRELLPNLKAGAMTRIEIIDKHIRPSLSLSLNYTPIPFIAASLSYTIMNSKIDQVGAGLALGNRGAQFYILTDNIPLRFTRNSGSSLIWPYNARMLSLRFGFNLLFGCKEKENIRRPGKQRRDDVCPAYW
jgi:hypothetical protein